MKLFQRLLVLVGILVALSISTQTAQAGFDEPSEPYPGMPLCLPDVYLVPQDDCLPLEPSQTLTEMARMGMSYPQRPLPVVSPPTDLTKNPAYIAKINIDPTEPVRLYASLDDAVGGVNSGRTIAPGNGLRYVSYIQEARINGNSFVMLKSGESVRASPASSSTFQGVLFTKTPTTGFGWVFDTIRARSKPSFTAPEVGDLIYRETFVPIYKVIEAEGMEWYLIGIDQWVPYLKARRARVDSKPPDGVTGDRWISVDLYDQMAMAYENRQLVFATLISTGGEPFYTWPGLFQIYEKKPFETMSGAALSLLTSIRAESMTFYRLPNMP